MKLKLALTATVIGLICMTEASAADSDALQSDPNMIGLTTANGKLAYDYLDLWFNHHQPEAAFDKYVSRTDYMNHSVYAPEVAGQRKSFAEEKAFEKSMTAPNMRFDFKQIVAQGDLVFTHIHAFDGQNPYGDEMLIILRIKNGKVVDSWDIHAPLKKDSAVFDGLKR